MQVSMPGSQFAVPSIMRNRGDRDLSSAFLTAAYVAGSAISIRTGIDRILKEAIVIAQCRRHHEWLTGVAAAEIHM